MGTAEESGSKSQPIPPKNATFTEKNCKSIEELGLANKKVEEGVSKVKRDFYTLTVHNHAGYVCQIDLIAHFKMRPDTLFGILSNPDNSLVFRDIHSCTYRQVLETDHMGYNMLEVEQLAEIKILFWKGYLSTLLLVEEEKKQLPYTMTFSLKKSGMMNKFSGQWKLNKQPDGEGVVATLSQAVLPSGCPPWMAHLPFVGRILRGGAARIITRLMEDLKSMDDDMAKGNTLQEVFERRRQLLRATSGNQGPRPGEDAVPVHSHVLTMDDLDDDDDDHELPCDLKPNSLNDDLIKAELDKTVAEIQVVEQEQHSSLQMVEGEAALVEDGVVGFRTESGVGVKAEAGDSNKQDVTEGGALMRQSLSVEDPKVALQVQMEAPSDLSEELGFAGAVEEMKSEITPAVADAPLANIAIDDEVDDAVQTRRFQVPYSEDSSADQMVSQLQEAPVAGPRTTAQDTAEEGLKIRGTAQQQTLSATEACVEAAAQGAETIATKDMPQDVVPVPKSAAEEVEPEQAQET